MEVDEFAGINLGACKSSHIQADFEAQLFKNSNIIYGLSWMAAIADFCKICQNGCLFCLFGFLIVFLKASGFT